jgi:hypothetical protein
MTHPMRRRLILAEAGRCCLPIQRFSPVPLPAGSIYAMGFVFCLLLPLLLPPSCCPPDPPMPAVPTISIVNQLLFFTSLPPPPTHPKRGNPTPRDGESALDYAAFGVIVRNTNLAVVATDTRASSNDTVATLSAGGPGPASTLIFSAY